MCSIIVTGATSMIGIEIIKEAILDNDIDRIIAVVRSSTKKRGRLPQSKKMIVLELDYNEYEKMPKYIDDLELEVSPSIFYHLAWSRTPTYQESYSDMLTKCESISGVLKAVCAAKEVGCKKFVYTGGQAEYGIVNDEFISSDTPCNPVRADGIAHLAAGKMGRILCEQFGIPFIWIRVFSVYGVNDRPDSMISVTVRKMMNNEACQFTKAEQIWDYLNAKDLGQAILLSGEKADGNKIYCVGSGEAKPLKEYIKIIRDVVNPKMELRFGELPYPSNPVMRLCPDISELVKDTGWRPLTSFRDGIEEIFKWEQKKHG